MSVARLALDALAFVPPTRERDGHLAAFSALVEDYDREITLRAVMAWRAWPLGAQG